jgi:uncharacterized membrane protein YoaK (UPF0700 family)
MSRSGFTELNPANMRAWFLLAFQAGAVNAGGFIACKRFVTHTTGFATLFGYEFGQLHFGEALGMLSVPFFFFLGAGITAFFVDLPKHRGKGKPNFRVPAWLIFFTLSTAGILGELGVFSIFGEAHLKHDYFFLVLLCLASGLQNALITNANGVVVRTTHLTGLTTDLAVGLVRTFFSGGAPTATRERHAAFARVGIIASFVLGAMISALLFLRAQYLGFALPVFTSLVVLRYFYVRTDPREVS